MIKKYIQLIKPGIIVGNVVTAVAGYLMVEGSFDLKTFMGMLIGLSCIIGSGCAFNNYMDRFFDEKMQRTKTRPLVQGTISKRQALSIASVLLIVGVLLLYITTNLICLGCSLCGFIIYVGLYTPIKVRSVHGTWIGSLAGATPPLVGYSAACQRLDITALLLFLVVALWQMPHFYAIAIYRLADYSSACIPVLPVAKGIDATKKHMLAYTIAFSTCCLLLYFFSSLSYFYLLAAIFCSVVWLAMAFGGMKKQDDEKWAKKMFRFSLVIIMTLSLALSLR